MTATKDIFQRSELLLGQTTLKMMAHKRVIIFGIGGVGSWCAEALVRTGFQQLTIVDFDKVDVTNINRQLMATTETVGRPKVEVLLERLLTINPEAQITAIAEAFTDDSASRFTLEDYDYIIDAIDSLQDKAQLILRACKTQAKLFSSMGAALKLDATKIQVAEFWKVKGDPLARALRHRFKKEQTFPKRKFLCVYSDEAVQNAEMGKGSLVHITASFGMMLAGLVTEDVRKQM